MGSAEPAVSRDDEHEPATGSGRKSVAEVKRDELLTLLDHEITSASVHATRSGWTSYAVTGAIGALAWLVLAEIESGSTDLVDAVAALLLTSCVLDLLGTLHMLLSSRLPLAEPRFLWPGALMSRRWFVAARGIRGVLLAALAGAVLPAEHQAARWLVIVYFGVEGSLLIGCAVGLRLLARFPVPSPHREPPKLLPWIGAVSAALAMALLWTLGPVLPWTSSTALAQSLQVGGGIAVVLFLAVLLVRSMPDDWDADALKFTRRRLVLGQDSVAEAARWTDIVVGGRRSSDVLRPYVVRLHTELGAAHDTIAECRAALSALSPPHVAGVGASTPAPAVARLARAKCEELAGDAADLLTEAGRTLERTRGMALLLSSMSPAARTETGALIGQLETALAAATAEHEELTIELAPRRE